MTMAEIKQFLEAAGEYPPREPCTALGAPLGEDGLEYTEQVYIPFLIRQLVCAIQHVEEGRRELISLIDG